jgi:hypothetical protein
VGAIGVSGHQTWDITESSYQALFQSHAGRTVTVPQTLAEMTQIPEQGRTTWSYSELLALGRSLSPTLISGTTAHVAVIFVNGTYNGNQNILGIHFTGSPFAFIFKDIVLSVGGDPVSQRYAEQAVVVHELGHVVGFVNNGVPLVTNHEDSSHAHHTTNSDCVMYWAVESKDNILTSIADLILGNQLNLFGAEVLQDAQAYHP